MDLQDSLLETAPCGFLRFDDGTVDTLDVDGIGERIVPIVPSVEGEPAPGFLVGNITVEPATVEIVGPESILRRVTEAITEPVWVGSAQSDVTATAIYGIYTAGVYLTCLPGGWIADRLIGAQDEVIFLEFSTREMAALGISQQDVMQTLRAQNAVAPSGVAYVEELLWDRTLWHDREWLFGTGFGPGFSSSGCHQRP